MKKKVEKSNSIIEQFSKIKSLYFHPVKFLKSAEKELNYSSLIFFFLIIYLTYLILSIIIQFSFGQIEFNVWIVLRDIINGMLFAIISPFVVSAIIFLGIKIFKGKEGFFKVFKPIIYSFSIVTLYGILVVICYRIIPYTPLQSELISSAQNLEVIKQIYLSYYSQVGVILGSIIGFIGNIHALIFAIIGISKYQKMTKTKTVFAIIVSSLITLAIISIYLIILVLAVGLTPPIV